MSSAVFTLALLLFCGGVANAQDAPAPAPVPEAVAETEAAAPSEPMAESPAADAEAATATETAVAETAEAEPTASDAAPVPDALPSARPPVQLGPVGYDPEGNTGRVHTVVRGETLWAISDAYLSTPWVWPSVWRANDAVANPHRIYPGDLLWISAGLMRKISQEEADALLAGEPLPAALDDALPGRSAADYTFSAIEATGIVTDEELAAATEVLGSRRESIWLAQMDPITLGYGEGETSVGDQFTVFRTEATAYNPENDRVWGKFVQVLGWAEVTEVHGETSTAVIRTSYSEIRRGDRVVPREMPVPDVDYRPVATEVTGQVLHLPDRRNMLGNMDAVYLNRGDVHGVQVGNRLEVFRPGKKQRDSVRREKLRLPDDVIGELLVVKVEDETALAVVTGARTELAWGDRFRSRQE